MWGLVIVCFLVRLGIVSGQNPYFSDVDGAAVEAQSKKNLTRKTIESSSPIFVDTTGTKYVDKKSGTQHHVSETVENGRRLKYKRAEFKFMMKAFFFMKVLFGLVLPLGIITSKILSWKAVTLSLMAFMLAKILFVKNLLSGKPSSQVTPTNYFPPFLLQNGVNDAIWKRQGDMENLHTWTQT